MAEGGKGKARCIGWALQRHKGSKHRRKKGEGGRCEEGSESEVVVAERRIRRQGCGARQCCKREVYAGGVKGRGCVCGRQRVRRKGKGGIQAGKAGSRKGAVAQAWKQKGRVPVLPKLSCRLVSRGKKARREGGEESPCPVSKETCL